MAAVTDADIALTARELVRELGETAAVFVTAWTDERVEAGDEQGEEVCRRLLKEIKAILSINPTGCLS